MDKPKSLRRKTKKKNSKSSKSSFHESLMRLKMGKNNQKRPKSNQIKLQNHYTII